MEMNRNEATRTITVWLTNADQQNEAIRNWLKRKYPVWKKQGYLTADYLSGHEDLYENTLALLKYNRRLSAQKEVEAEKRARKQAEAERQAAAHPAAEKTAAPKLLMMKRRTFSKVVLSWIFTRDTLLQKKKSSCRCNFLKKAKTCIDNCISSTCVPTGA